MDVYMFSGSAHSWKVLLGLEIKGQHYEVTQFSSPQTDLKSTEFLALNPRGKVPVIRNGAYCLPESSAILAYLERKYPEPPLFGRTAEETGLIWKAILDFDLYVSHDWVSRIIVPIFTGQALTKAGEIRQAMPACHAELARLEAAVGNGGWIAESQLSAADITVFPTLEALLRACGKKEVSTLDIDLLPFETRYPALEAWRRKIRSMPAYDRTYPAYWRKIDQGMAA